MRPPRLGTLFALAACLILVPASASAIPIHRHMSRTIVKGSEIPVRIVHWTEVVNVAPRDSDEDGVKNTKDECPQDAGSLDNGCDPAPVVSPSVTQATGYAPAPPYSGSAGGCVGMEAESGSLGYASPNGGCYQVIPSTAAAFDCDLSTPAGQDSCAADICAEQGPSAWTNPAGQNPCGRLGG